MMLAYKSIKMS